MRAGCCGAAHDARKRGLAAMPKKDSGSSRTYHLISEAFCCSEEAESAASPQQAVPTRRPNVDLSAVISMLWPGALSLGREDFSREFYVCSRGISAPFLRDESVTASTSVQRGASGAATEVLLTSRHALSSPPSDDSSPVSHTH